MLIKTQILGERCYALLTVLMSLMPLFYMAIRGWINTGLILIAALSIVASVKELQAIKRILRLSSVKWVIIALIMPLIAVVVAQLLRGDFSARMLDGPFRAFLAAWVFIFCVLKNIKLLDLFQYTLPVSLLILIIVVHFDPAPVVFWGGRFSTYFVDPLTLGGFSLIIGFMCLIMIDKKCQNNWIDWSNTLKFMGLVAGVYLSFGSMSRSGWVAVPVLLLWVGMRFKKSVGDILVIYSSVILIFMLICYIDQNIYHRFLSIFSETTAWFDERGDNDVSSAGIRLGLWVLSYDLISKHPFAGYGDRGYEVLLWNDPDIMRTTSEVVRNTLLKGPHNEYIASMLRSGVLGLIADIALLAIPVMVVFSGQWYNANQRKIAYMIAVLCSGLAICSMTLEVFYLKYAISFYSFMIATLLAQFVLEMPDQHR